MTTPNAAEEFMRSLDQHPEIEQELRRRLLTQELLDLPNTVGKLATAISEMREIFDRRLTSLESQQSENTEQQQINPNWSLAIGTLSRLGTSR